MADDVGHSFARAILRLRMAAWSAAPPFAALLSASSGAGCAPSCADEPVQEQRGVVVTKDTRGRLVPLERPTVSFATCRDLCESAPAAAEITSCEVTPSSTFRSPASSNNAGLDGGDGEDRFTVLCTGAWAQCKNQYTLGSGRRPEGYPSTPLRSILHEMARLEAASVIAFERIASELVVHGAPTALVEQARVAIADENRHARLVLALADSLSPRDHAPELDFDLDRARCPTTPRALFDLALENAREGVIHETFGALVNDYQAAHALDPDIRTLFAHLADDEISHAALSLRIHQWAVDRLRRRSADDVTLIHREMHRALAELRAHCAPHPERGELLGQPSRPTQLAILATLEHEVWSLCA